MNPSVQTVKDCQEADGARQANQGRVRDLSAAE